MKKFFISSALFAALMFVVSCGDVSINAPSDPTTDPTANPTTNPTTEPTAEPTGEPTAEPTSDESDDNGFGGTGECEISDSYTDVSFDQYFRFKGTALVNDYDKLIASSTAFTEAIDKTTKLYISSGQKFEVTDGKEDGDWIFALLQDDVGDASRYKILDKYKGEGLYLAVTNLVDVGEGYYTAGLYVMTPILNSKIKSGKKDPNGRVNLESAPDVIVFNFEYHDIDTEKAWMNMCPVAVTKQSEKNGGAQLCPGEDGTFDANQTVKIGIKAELSADEKDIIALVDGAKSVEELCVADCFNDFSELDPETNECRCMEGYSWNGYECAETSFVDPCEPNPCESVENGEGSCILIDAGEYKCGCEDGYVWNGATCIND